MTGTVVSRQLSRLWRDDLSSTMKIMLHDIGLLKRCAWTLPLAGLVLLTASAFAAVSPAHRQHAVAAMEKAEQMRAALEARTESKRTRGEYKKVINAYSEVHRQNPAYSKTPVALAAVAELYREMGQVFSSDSYYLESIKAYRFLMKEYPQKRISRDALFTVGEIYRADLEDQDQARKAFHEYIVMYPKTDNVGEAQEKLKQIDLKAEERGKARPAPPPVEVEKAAEERHAGPPQVMAVRRWVGPNYSRIVIGVNSEVKFDSVRLANPDRIVLNLQNSRLSPELVGKKFPVEDGFLRQIRLAQFSPEVTRVVLDVEKIENYSVFTLPNPFRLVIDVQGAPLPQMAKAAKPVTPENPESRKSDKVRPPATTSPAPAARVETAPKSQPQKHVKTEQAPAASDKEKGATTVGPPGTTAPGTKSKEQPETLEGNVTPPIRPATPTESGSRTLTRALGLKIGRIVIDPGHGGHDTGTLGPTGLEEKEVVLDVGLRLRKLLEQNTGCEVVMTRSDDTFIPLEERTAIANEKGADLFISIHANASRDQSARGIETYYLNLTSSPDALEVVARENATSKEAVHQLQDLIKKIAMTEKIEESQDFARQVQREVFTRVTKVSGAQRDRGIKKAPFVVLIGANMPSVLAEISFLTNPRDERLMRRPDYREKIASALYEGIVGYVRNLGEVRTAQHVAADQTSDAARAHF
jgi:N-acetylmuramoyl-L-alanine amidase